MVGMKMGQKKRVHLPERDLELPEALARPTSCIEQKALVARFHERARPKSVNDRIGAAGAEKRHPQSLRGLRALCRKE